MKDLTFEEIEKSVSQNSALEDVYDGRDLRFGEIMAGDIDLPETFSIREDMTSVKSQGSRGTCVGFSCVGITEFFNSKEFLEPNLNLSEEFLFRKIKDIDIADYGYEGYGAYLRSGAKALQKWGTCLEALAPYVYNGTETEWKNFNATPKLVENAAQYRMKSYLAVDKDKEEIKRALVTSGTPLLAGVRLFSSYKEAKTNGGFIPEIKTGDKYIGGHAMIITGYTETHIEFKNSFGSGWGDNGYIYWPWSELKRLHGQAWSFVDLETNPAVVKENLIEANKKLLLDHQKESWDKALAKKVANENTRPTDNLTKGDLMVFLNRLNLLD